MKITNRIENILVELNALHADAQAQGLPQGVVMGLHWLCEDAGSTLAHARAMEATAKEDRQEQTGDQPELL